MRYFWSKLLPALRTAWRTDAHVDNMSHIYDDKPSHMAPIESESIDSSTCEEASLLSEQDGYLLKNELTPTRRLDTLPSDSINTFPFSEKEVNWALDHFVDADGSLSRNDFVNFQVSTYPCHNILLIVY